MEVENFNNSPVGRVVVTSRRYHAFVPNRLPRNVNLAEHGLVRLIADAERTIGKLSGIAYLVPNPDFLVIPYTRLEAVASSRIEGTQTSLSELFYYEAFEDKPVANDDLLEVASYVNALNLGLELLKTLPLSIRLIREVHKVLMSGMRGGSPDKTPGEIRTTQNWIGGHDLRNAVYVPPPPEHLWETLDDWEKFINERDLDMPILVQCALMHYQFEAIHPFLDGNGRVGRLLITLFLCEREVLPVPLLYLSYFFERHRSEYYDRLLDITMKGDWANWLRFFLHAVITQGEHAIESAKRIVDQRERYRQDLQMNGASASILKLLDFVFTNPYFTVRQVEKNLNVSYPTAQKTIKVLVNKDILEEITGYKRNRVYVANKLLQLLTDNEPPYRPNQDALDQSE